MSIYKTAGPDGLRPEFFKSKKEVWAEMITNVMNEIGKSSKTLPTCLISEIIILIHKKAPSETVVNYRPIALVNVLAKMASMVYCNRLKPLPKHIIPPAQAGFVPGRTITGNIILTHDIMHWCKTNCPEPMLVSLGFEKAYDRVQIPYSHKTLQKMRFGQKFSHFTTKRYHKRSAALSINDIITTSFDMTRGVQ